MAGTTGLEPATSDVTGRRSRVRHPVLVFNHLNFQIAGSWLIFSRAVAMNKIHSFRHRRPDPRSCTSTCAKRATRHEVGLTRPHSEAADRAIANWVGTWVGGFRVLVSVVRKPHLVTPGIPSRLVKVLGLLVDTQAVWLDPACVRRNATRGRTTNSKAERESLLPRSFRLAWIQLRRQPGSGSEGPRAFEVISFGHRTQK